MRRGTVGRSAMCGSVAAAIDAASARAPGFSVTNATGSSPAYSSGSPTGNHRPHTLLVMHAKVIDGGKRRGRDFGR